MRRESIKLGAEFLERKTGALAVARTLALTLTRYGAALPKGHSNRVSIRGVRTHCDTRS